MWLKAPESSRCWRGCLTAPRPITSTSISRAAAATPAGSSAPETSRDGMTFGPALGSAGQRHRSRNMMLDWAAYRDQINTTVKEMSETNPDIVKAYAAFHHANSSSKHLDAKTRELIALGVAVSLR